MHRREILSDEECEALPTSRSAQQILTNAVLDCAGERPVNLKTACLMAWVVVHGYVSLVLTGHFIPPGSQGYEQQTQQMAEELLEHMRPLYTGSTQRDQGVMID